MRTKVRMLTIVAIALVAVVGIYQMYRTGLFADQAANLSSEKKSITGKEALSEGQLQDVVVTDDGYVQLAPAR